MSNMDTESRLQPELPALENPDIARLPRVRLESMLAADEEILECMAIRGFQRWNLMPCAFGRCVSDHGETLYLLPG